MVLQTRPEAAVMGEVAEAGNNDASQAGVKGSRVLCGVVGSLLGVKPHSPCPWAPCVKPTISQASHKGLGATSCPFMPHGNNSNSNG